MEEELLKMSLKINMEVFATFGEDVLKLPIKTQQNLDKQTEALQSIQSQIVVAERLGEEIREFLAKAQSLAMEKRLVDMKLQLWKLGKVENEWEETLEVSLMEKAEFIVESLELLKRKEEAIIELRSIEIREVESCKKLFAQKDQEIQKLRESIEIQDQEIAGHENEIEEKLE